MVNAGLVSYLLLHEWCAYIRGADGVAGDSVFGSLQGGDAGQAEQAVFSGDVGGFVGGGAHGVDGGDVHDAAPALPVHVGQDSFGEGEGRGEHDGYDLLPLLHGKLDDRRDVLDSRVVHEDVDLAFVVLNGVHEALDRGGIGQVAADETCVC